MALYAKKACKKQHNAKKKIRQGLKLLICIFNLFKEIDIIAVK